MQHSFPQIFFQAKGRFSDISTQQTTVPYLLCRQMNTWHLNTYNVSGSGSVTSVGEERANLPAIVYL